MSRKLLFVFAVLAFVTLAVLALQKNKNKETQDSQPPSIAKASQVDSSATGQPSSHANPTLKSSSTAAPVSSAKSEGPSSSAASVQTLPAIPREETPQAVLDWSTDVGRGMLEAFKSPAQADKMFSFLRTCAENKSAGLTYRAICSANAKRLAERFPEKYSQDFNGFKRGLPERIQKFLEQAKTNF